MKRFEYNIDYTKTMMMKMPMSFPDRKGGSKVVLNFSDALEIIKKIDVITCGMPKIIYLVGWQYNGHDDKYPDFFEVNPALKFADKNPQQSMIWLMNESRKYNTIISVHINFNDAYANAPSIDRFVKAKALIRNKKGLPKAIENYNGLKCYKTSFKEYWESGLFKEMFDRLLTVLPLQDAKTIHVDNFQCYKNYSPDIDIATMQKYRMKMIEYVASKGIDITSEFTYREDERLRNKPFLGLPREHHKTTPMNTLGYIPAVWWHARVTKEDMLATTPQQYCGGMYRRNVFNTYLYGNMHAEEIFKKFHDNKSDWESEFIKEFATYQVPFNYLCNFKRLQIEGKGKDEYCVFSDNVISYSKNGRIVKDNEVIKQGNTLLMPIGHQKDTYIAYSDKESENKWKLIKDNYKIAKISEYRDGQYVSIENKEVKDGKIGLVIKAGQLLRIQFS